MVSGEEGELWALQPRRVKALLVAHMALHGIGLLLLLLLLLLCFCHAASAVVALL
jgi:hypothetical protein